MKVCVLGSGSWGTALAQVLIDNHVDTIIWGKDENEVNDINLQHKNTKYFGDDVILNEKLIATTDINCVRDADLVLLAVPSIAIESVCKMINPLLEKQVIVINVAKGFHPETHERLSVVIKRFMDQSKLKDVVSLIGPSHAEEVIQRLLTTVNAVCENEESAILVQKLFSNDVFRVYRNTDVVGAEIGVALKNVMALASGVLSGLDQGDNARAALMTRGLAEMSRYGIAQGGRPETYLGLTGVGDLIVTCTSHHSRNFQAGYQIGKANSATDFLMNNHKTVEGVKAAKVVYEEAQKQGIEMPITEEVYKVLYEDKKPSEAIRDLMSRELKSEEN
ncbi:NAD(P)H-dependent glycerol-3-phosphate dehydrogenase [Anaerorhabdus furcosa]|uniref:Glycerol-3-phosphate dehydrogenase [NAD(P)+] n=1 Tax=Anaerorhabdus furcosa TaxID=118967 RepID=A0A1T4P8K4_9FIRM|nr:NAD(P)H-dependent glycerol-3-phosphate dehydrogenase [Anaerorhabdus furcosa]SJZ87789.1 glycerol-3-phosphate dehydrogenase (NAD(P)+) [Anaerorhabdus furcosa]